MGFRILWAYHPWGFKSPLSHFLAQRHAPRRRDSAGTVGANGPAFRADPGPSSDATCRGGVSTLRTERRSALRARKMFTPAVAGDCGDGRGAPASLESCGPAQCLETHRLPPRPLPCSAVSQIAPRRWRRRPIGRCTHRHARSPRPMTTSVGSLIKDRGSNRLQTSGAGSSVSGGRPPAASVRSRPLLGRNGRFGTAGSISPIRKPSLRVSSLRAKVCFRIVQRSGAGADSNRSWTSSLDRLRLRTTSRASWAGGIGSLPAE